MPTVRNARGADLYAASDDEATVLPIQSKALSKRSAVPLGASLDNLRSPWWVITLRANSDSPTCYILTMEEVRQLATRTVNGKGVVSHWLEPKHYAVPEYEEAWHRLGSPDDSEALKEA